MIRTLIIAALLALAQPALAQSCPTVDDAIRQLTADPADIEPYAVIAEPEVVKAAVEVIAGQYPSITGFVVSRLLVAVISGHPVFGIEVDGCVSRPMPWPQGMPFPLPLTKGIPA